MKLIDTLIQSDNSLDVIHPDLLSDYDLFFGPIELGVKPLIQEFKSTADLLVTLGLVPSKSWCRKNNWDKPLNGYTEIVFGSKRVKICILMKGS